MMLSARTACEALALWSIEKIARLRSGKKEILKMMLSARTACEALAKEKG